MSTIYIHYVQKVWLKQTFYIMYTKNQIHAPRGHFDILSVKIMFSVQEMYKKHGKLATV